MIQRDYILRMIEEAAQAISALIGMRKGGKYEEMLKVLGETYRAYFPFDGELLRNTEEEDFIAYITKTEDVPEEMLGVLADLLREEGEYWFFQGQYDKSSANFRRAVMILKHQNKLEPGLYSMDRVQKLSVLEKLLDRLKSS